MYGLDDAEADAAKGCRNKPIPLTREFRQDTTGSIRPSRPLGYPWKYR